MTEVPGDNVPADNDEAFERTRAQVRAERDFYQHMLWFVCINLLLTVTNVVIVSVTKADAYWFYWPLLGWGIGLAAHAFAVFGPMNRLDDDWERRQIEKRLGRGPSEPTPRD